MPGKYASVAVHLALSEMREAGTRLGHVTAQAIVLADAIEKSRSVVNKKQRNVKLARKNLETRRKLLAKRQGKPEISEQIPSHYLRRVSS